MFGNKEKRQDRRNRRQDRREKRKAMKRGSRVGGYGTGTSDIFAKYGGSVGSIGPNGVL
jgi:hypothetical protein|tara:strand:- start:3150 stop:3326 length:177 start_codon:yes stop_codon:yes gene_type:complete